VGVAGSMHPVRLSLQMGKVVMTGAEQSCTLDGVKHVTEAASASRSDAPESSCPLPARAPVAPASPEDAPAVDPDIAGCPEADTDPDMEGDPDCEPDPDADSPDALAEEPGVRACSEHPKAASATLTTTSRPARTTRGAVRLQPNRRVGGH
jgi:hypothetical protein